MRARSVSDVSRHHKVDVLGRYSNRRDLGRVLDRLAGLPTVVRDQPVLRARQRFVDEEMEDALVAEYAAGASTYELGRRFGLPRQRVSEVLLKRGVEPRYRVVADDMVAETREMRNVGFSQSAIAEHFGVARSTVSRALGLS